MLTEKEKLLIELQYLQLRILTNNSKKLDTIQNFIVSLTQRLSELTTAISPHQSEEIKANFNKFHNYHKQMINESIESDSNFLELSERIQASVQSLWGDDFESGFDFKLFNN